MDTIFYVFSAIAIALSFVPLLPSSHWTVRVWEFPRLQIAVVQFLLLLLGIVLLADRGLTGLHTGLLVGLTIALIYQTVWIVPYTPLYTKEVKSCETAQCTTLRILSSNVYMPNSNFEALLVLVKKFDPDFLVTLESNKKWQDGLSELSSNYPHQQRCPLENLYGMHLYSKHPFRNIELRFLVEDDVPSIKADIEVNGHSITLYFVHPKPPSPTENHYAAPRDKELHIVGKEIASDIEKHQPVIVAGDLNDVAWSPTTRKFKKISGLLDPRVGRGFYNTFHAHYPLVKWPLDHVFHSRHFALSRIERLSDIGSDHYPLFTELCISSEA